MNMAASRGRAIAAAVLVVTMFVATGPTLAEGRHGHATGERGAAFCQKHDVRVGGPRLNVRLSGQRRSYRPGATARFRVENRGAVPIGLNHEGFVVERYQGSSWVRDPITPDNFPRNRLGGVASGAVGFCREFAVPDGMAPGTYRFRKDVRLPRGGAKRLTVMFVVKV
jgi:hypothetical protein